MGGEHTHEPNKIYGTGADSSHPFGNAAKPGVYYNIMGHAKVLNAL